MGMKLKKKLNAIADAARNALCRRRPRISRTVQSTRKNWRAHARARRLTLTTLSEISERVDGTSTPQTQHASRAAVKRF
jgi:hypothetical protein